MNFYNKHILPKLLNSAMKREEMEKHRPDVVAHASGTVLEIGFGSGLNLPYYKDITKLYALEPLKELYDIAYEKISHISFPLEYLQASAEKIPFVDSSIDSVISTWTLCSIPHPEMALKEILRVLKPQGKFVFIEHGKSPRSFIARLQNIFTPVSRCIAGGCYMNREIEKLVIDAGFKIQNLETFQLKLKPLAFMYKGIGFKS